VRDSGSLLWAVMASVAATTAPSPRMVTASAWRWASSGIWRRKALTVDRPRASAVTISTSTAKVVTPDAAAGARLPAPDEHEHVGDQP